MVDYKIKKIIKDIINFYEKLKKEMSDFELIEPYRVESLFVLVYNVQVLSS